MNIHEYQAKSLLKSYGISVPEGGVVSTPRQAVTTSKSLTGPWVLKAQIHAGGRGKGGGIKIVSDLSEIESTANSLLGMILITPQTGPDGKRVRKIYIEQKTSFSQAFYLSLMIDGATSRLVFLASSEGGGDIEEIAQSHPHKIKRVVLDPISQCSPFEGRKLAYGLGLKGPLVNTFGRLMQNLTKAFLDMDASLIELNPLVVTEAGNLMALDGKISFDDNALYRHPELLALRDTQEEDPLERKAAEEGITYIKLQGNIGCLVNGAGLAMATMDLLKHYGGEPANFLDVGGSADQKRVCEAFKLILSDPQVKGIFVNIFGGIIRCDVIAEGIVAAVKETGLSCPLVVRLEGTNSALGQDILRASELPLIALNDLSQAAKRIVKEVP